MKTISLNGLWAGRGQHQTKGADLLHFNAEVPGTIQLDLCRASYLPEDIFMGDNITLAEQYEEYEWWLERTFEAPRKSKNVYLVFEGADCICEYFLNGKKIGESENMFISHEFLIDDFLVDGENNLLVHISSPLFAVRAEKYTLKLFCDNRNLESRFIRKAPHSYGWDIMPRMLTAGLWRGVHLEVRDPISFSETFFIVNQKHTKFCYTLKADEVRFDDLEIEISGSSGNDSTFYKRFPVKKPYGCMSFEIENRKLWFPFGYGDANVYDGVAKIYRAGELIHEEKFSFGIRDVVLDRRDALDGDAGQFRFLINDIEVMCLGSNWVPLDAFHSRDAERYEKALQLVKDIGCNILRCWGGNVYEDHAFFDFCDRNGIMVWQDFSMACANYPEDEEFRKKLEAEATHIVRKLRNHPSLILWAGDNEVDSCSLYHDPNTNTLTREVLPRVIDQNDIGRPYLASSPYISPEAYRGGQRSQVHGSPLVEDHLWGPRDYFKSDFYANNKAHFVSETGYHGCPALSSIRRFITPERVWPYADNPEWSLHSSDQEGRMHRVMLMERQVRQLFGEVPTDPEEYILASQISQGEAKKFFIERIRIGRPYTTGIIWWNLLDGWPQMSDAVVDYYFEKKLAYYYIKRSQAPFSIMAGEITSWHLPLYACNNFLVKKEGHLTVVDTSDDTVVYEGDFTVGENQTKMIGRIKINYSHKTILLMRWETADGVGYNHYLNAFAPVSLAMYKRVLKKYKLGEDASCIF